MEILKLPPLKNLDLLHYVYKNLLDLTEPTLDVKECIFESTDLRF